MNQSATQTHDLVKEYYGKVLSTSKDLKTSACCTADAAPSYLIPLFKQVPCIIRQKYYGCGFPVPPAIDGAAILDLGCGTGRDVYLAAQLIGDGGRVVGVDMTDEQLAVAREHKDKFIAENNLKADQIEFVQGYIEKLDEAGLEANSFDVVISNCVVNLSPDKRAVLEGIYRVLKEGGEFYFSDVFVDRRLPDEISRDEILYGECLGGALYHHDFIFLANDIGFKDVRRVTAREIDIHDPKIKAIVGNTRFYSITYRLFKAPSLDRQCEDYGQSVIYKGDIEGSDTLYWFDEHHAFEKGRAERVCGNTYDMLKGRYERYFTFLGDRSTHFGKYIDCDTMAAMNYRKTEGSSSASCC
jgi:SAM-dependent methyltransferase